MSDEADRRRALRRQRILGNAHERESKIFGRTSIPESTPNTENIDAHYDGFHELKNSTTPINEETSRISDQTRPVNHTIFRSEEPTVLAADRANNPMLSNLANLVNSLERHPREQQIHARRTDQYMPICAAVLVCTVFWANFSYLVSNSIAIPFILLELRSLCHRRNYLQLLAKQSGGIFPIALVLCGIPKAYVDLCSFLFTLVKNFLEDLALYIFTIVLWHFCIGGIEVLLPVMSSPETILE